MRKTKRPTTLDNLAVVHPNAAGLDIGAREIWACVPAGQDEQTVKRFNTFTPDLQALADWLMTCGVDTVAMESTGVYWIPVFEMLEARGLKVHLVNSWHLKHVPGRKKAQLGPMQALVATAYKIARTVYYMLKNRVQYHDIGAEAYEKKQQERELAYLKEKAARLGFDLLPHDPAAVAQAVALV